MGLGELGYDPSHSAVCPLPMLPILIKPNTHHAYHIHMIPSLPHQLSYRSRVGLACIFFFFCQTPNRQEQCVNPSHFV